MAGKKKLADYRAKRHFDRSAEPAGSERTSRDGDDGGDGGEEPLFVIQRHDASTLHFDFRLEVDGVLVSWAVPKGPSTDPRDKRFATRTEDHPLAYADFEGRIAKGEYGAGTVIVWDTGTYRNLTHRDDRSVPMAEGLAHGHVKVWLDGTKLSGGYALTRTRSRGKGDDWLLVKVDDEGADRRRKPAKTQLDSALSGRTNADLEDDGG